MRIGDFLETFGALLDRTAAPAKQKKLTVTQRQCFSSGRACQWQAVRTVLKIQKSITLTTALILCCRPGARSTANSDTLLVSMQII